MLKIPAPKTHIFLVCAGLFCFFTAFVLLHSFRGRFEQDTAAGLPELEDTIDVSAPKAAAVSENSLVSPVTQGSAGEAKWIIYVTGFVKKPGVYEIAAGSRVYQALEAAGGFTPDADTEGINLAAPLQDGAHIRFPGRNEKDSRTEQPSAAKPAGHGQPVLNAPKQAAAVNINTCSAAELTSLPGIGPKTAELILAYRSENGGFARIEDLLLVKGIGPKKYDAIRPCPRVRCIARGLRGHICRQPWSSPVSRCRVGSTDKRRVGAYGD